LSYTVVATYHVEASDTHAAEDILRDSSDRNAYAADCIIH